MQPRSQTNNVPIGTGLNGAPSPLLQPQVDSDHSSRSSSPSLIPPSAGGRRSRSPVVKALSSPQPQPRRTLSPSAPARNKTHAHHLSYRYLLPNTFCVSLPFPWGRQTLKVSGDVRKAGENIMLLASLIFGIEKTWNTSGNGDNWIAFGNFQKFLS